MPDIISRKEARARGLTRYFSGSPCMHGHIAERYVSGRCVQCGSRSNTIPRPRADFEWSTPPTPAEPTHGVITEASPAHWRVRCDDGRAFTIEIGNVVRQKTNLPLMIVGANVAFDLFEEFLPENVEVTP